MIQQFRKWALLAYLFLPINCIAFGQSTQPENVTIIRDTYGVPHIYGKIDADVAYGLAWAYCEDNFKSMQRIAMLGRGNMGMDYGFYGAVMDYFNAYIDTEGMVAQGYPSDLSPEYHSMYLSYCQAVNDYAKAHPKAVIWKKLFPVKPPDFLRGFMLIMGATIGVADAITSIRAGTPDSFMTRPGAVGSNAFAFSANYTKNTESYLVMNPHVPHNGFLTFYEAHLVSETGLNFYGAFIAGLPAPIMGTNGDIAWAVTFNWPDFVDIYRLNMQKGNSKNYLLDGQYQPLQQKRNIFWAKLGWLSIPIPRRTFFSAHGPVYRKRKKEAYATRFVANHPLRGVEHWYKIAKAKDITAFKAAFKDQSLPMFNFVYLDKQDNIHYIFNALLPKRDPRLNWQAVIPGDRSDLIWKSYLPVDSLPQLTNPQCAYLYNTNNSPFKATCAENNLNPAKFPTTCGWSWNRENNRDLRFRELMYRRPEIELEEVKRIKYDVYLPNNGPFKQMYQTVHELKAAEYPAIGKAIDVLQRWSYSGDSANLQAALAMIVLDKIFEETKSSLVELETGKQFPKSVWIKAIRYGQKFMLKHYNSLEVPLGQVQRLRRGNKSYAVSGIPEVLASSFGYINRKHELQMVLGDSFIGFVTFSYGKLQQLETVMPYGSSTHLKSTHAYDQMKLFAGQKTKKVELDKAKLLKDCSRVYHPGY
jgi:acyl-homoserine-lactone acylase